MRFARQLRFLSLIWLVAIFTATAGVSIHQIHCYCVGKTSVSLFGEAEMACMKKQVEEPSCCSKPKLPTCCQENQEKTSCDDEHDCGKETTSIEKLDSDFNFSFPVFESAPVVAELPPMTAWHFQVPSYHSCTPAVNKPPPLTGREIGIRFGQFLC